MKTTNKNEMDLLLRALGRKASAESFGQQVGPHLDADELNCFAEGVVSDAERARYIKHLADCDTCRSVVVGLVPAAASTRRHDVVEQKTWSLRERLAALFAPSVLRYAVPAVALATVLAIAVVALRQKQQTDFVAQNETPTSPALSSGRGGEAPATKLPQTLGSPGAQQPLREKNNPSEPRSDVIQPPAVVAGTGSGADRAKDLVHPDQPTVPPKSQPSSVTEPTDAAAPPPPPRPALSDVSKTVEARKEADADVQKQRRDDNYSLAREENEVARQGVSKGGPSRNNSGNMGTLMSRSANKDEKAAGSSVETRRVSGRLFRREGNVWVDADYAEGRATVKVNRGSEQFRALTADEPALRSIAEQLGGEVIVIWKGTAYRIR